MESCGGGACLAMLAHSNVVGVLSLIGVGIEVSVTNWAEASPGAGAGGGKVSCWQSEGSRHIISVILLLPLFRGIPSMLRALCLNLFISNAAVTIASHCNTITTSETDRAAARSRWPQKLISTMSVRCSLVTRHDE